ncbi:hypothetical protein FB45DRAFT_1031079 [Roridomyces roridus]|uniref:Uncharacterized protein n=1 Tax=Roridomyces roridus TaxID=1738132 RepID=A0AAD7FIU9_9AGAR|nr:hypothetical protein FB45DRAFT_1031079 [Roridomyces roridus]
MSSSASTSTISLLSTTTVSSRAPLNAAQPKDYQAAFATLQSTYGFAGTVPSPSPKSSTPRSVVPSTTSSLPARAAAPKDFESAFADLQSTYGFGGSVPSPVPEPKERSSGGFFSRFSRPAVAKPQAVAPSPSKIRHPPRPTAQITLL